MYSGGSMFMMDADNNGGKRSGFHSQHVQDSSDTKRHKRAEPSKVVHVRNLPKGATELELVELVRQYGNVRKTLLLNTKRQAFLEMETVAAAGQLLDATAINPPMLRGRQIVFQYSTRPEISLNENQKREDVPASNILLVSIADMRASVQIEHLEQVFSAHGVIEKIVIFEKNGFHAFVEMQNVDQASHARQRLHGQSLFIGCCTLSVQFSTLEKLNVPTTPNPRQSRDYGAIREARNSQIAQSTQMVGGGLFNPNTRYYATPQTALLQPSDDSQQRVQQMYGNGGMMSDSSLLGQPTFEMYNTSFMPIGQQQYQAQQQPQPQQHQSYNIPAHDGQINLEPGGVLFVNNLDEGKVDCDALFTLFGVFGDVYRVKIIYKKKSSALVQMANISQANLASNYLNHHILYGEEIYVTQSKYQDIQMPRQSEADGLTKDYSNSRAHRFKRIDSRNFKNVCAPSPILHIANLHDSATEEALMHVFADYDIRKIQFFKTNHAMALVETPDSDISSQILIKFHNSELCGRNMKISFSRKHSIPDLSSSKDNHPSKSSFVPQIEGSSPLVQSATPDEIASIE
uniref:Polypyrimidine tract-binding protein 1-like n=2 Tax=Hirondellea gigas TaxID=1518452 RepID=A0A2P2IAI3_9CRUS